MSEQEVILKTCKIIQDYNHKISNLTEEVKRLKQEVREAMIENDWKMLEDPDISVKCTRSYSFDKGQLNFIAPALYEKYKKVETITTEKVTIDLESLKRFEPFVFKECNIELTPRLTIK